MTLIEKDPALRYLTEDQVDHIASLEDSNPADVHAGLTRMPTSVYVSDERYALEQARLWRGRPVPMLMSAALPDNKSRVTVDDYGPSILVTRDEEGKVHAFHNVCTHRAIKLCQAKEAESGGLLVCPYHAWSFDMKGQLKGLPRPEAFPGLDKSKLGLVEMECLEAGGIIWVNMDLDRKADFSVVSDQLGPDLDALGLGKQKVYKHVRMELNTNWKLIIDSFSENYHVTRLHSESLKGMFVDRKTSCRMVGEHLRVLSGRAEFRAGETIETFEDFRKAGVMHYTIVPGALVITSPSYINVMLLAPAGVDRTVVNFYLLVDEMPTTEKGVQHYEKSLALMKRLTAEEDFWVAELGMIGAKSGAMPYMTVGGMEGDLVTFHQTVNAILED